MQWKNNYKKFILAWLILSLIIIIAAVSGCGQSTTTTTTTSTSTTQPTFVLQTLDASGETPSLVIDNSDFAHISYFDLDNNNLKYITNLSGTWEIEIVDTEDNATGWATSMALDANNHAHISYWNLYQHTIKYATNSSDSWETLAIDTSMNWGWTSGLALDSHGKAHISYCYSYGIFDSLKYATNANGSWETLTIEGGQTRLGNENSIAVNSSDKVYIAYFDELLGALKLATNASGSWEISVIDNNGTTGCTPHIAIDSSDKVHIAYYNYSQRSLKYATNASGSWAVETVDYSPPADNGSSASLAIDALGKAYISYSSFTTTEHSKGLLKYATNASGSWQTYIVDDEDDFSALYTSIKLNSRNKVCISYHFISQADHGYLKYAEQQ